MANQRPTKLQRAATFIKGSEPEWHKRIAEGMQRDLDRNESLDVWMGEVETLSPEAQLWLRSIVTPQTNEARDDAKFFEWCYARRERED